MEGNEAQGDRTADEGCAQEVEKRGLTMLNEAEVDALPPEKRLEECPLCGCKECEGHPRCFHCMECGYLQCCDYDGFYDRHRKKSEQKD